MTSYKTYRCRDCGRRLSKPAYTAPAGMGGWVLGPVCAAKAKVLSPRHNILAEPKKRQRTKSASQNRETLVLPGQLRLFP